MSLFIGKLVHDFTRSIQSRHFFCPHFHTISIFDLVGQILSQAKLIFDTSTRAAIVLCDFTNEQVAIFHRFLEQERNK